MVTTLKRAWQRLTRAAPGKTQAELAEKYTHFQALLSANNQVLTLMADMEEKLSGDYLFDLQYIRAAVSQLRQKTGQLVDALHGLGGNRYQGLSEALTRISREVEEVLTRRREIPVAPLVIDFEALNATMGDVVGGKNANLGEVKNRVGLPVPGGFAISTHAYKVFLDHNHLAARIMAVLESRRLEDLDSLDRVSAELNQMILVAQAPPELEAAIMEAYDQLVAREPGQPMVAMRSSVVSADLTLTFAGQYTSYLNLPPEILVKRYKDIVASLFTSRALFYYKNKGFKEEEMAMGVVVMPMIQARVSGVLFTRRPEGTGPEAKIIAGWGPGHDGLAAAPSTDHYLLAYEPWGQILDQVILPKPLMPVCRPDCGLEEVPVHPDYVNTPCLKDSQLRQLLEVAQKLEEYWQHPQRVDWALDYQNRLWILNCQPLALPHAKGLNLPPRTLKGHRILLDRGDVACRGTGAGPVVLVRPEDDLSSFPDGGVLVARHTSPKFVAVMSKAAAILTDVGSPTGHMALLVREFQVPTIINIGNATQILAPGQVVTVDANYNNVYEGLIPELLEPSASSDDLTDSSVFQTLKAVVQRIVPLNLINPEDEATFTPENCRTLHDIVRYAHEFSMREMFRLTEHEVQGAAKIVYLDSNLPLKMRLLDLGGGINRGWRRKVRPPQVVSQPFQAFWGGLTAGPWASASPPEVGSPPTVLPPGEAETQGADRDRSYAVLSNHYLNLNLRLGYHRFTVEAYITDQVNDNYLTFGFREAGATPELRAIRARLLEAILNRLELSTQRKGDLIEARLAKYSPEQTADCLTRLGKLTSYINQLDISPVSDNMIDWYVDDFVGQ
jgi:pyruvate,water dikinase